LARGHGGIRVEQPEATLTTTLAGEQLSTFQRLDEVAAILATGMLRLGAGSGKSRPPESRFGWTTRPSEACMLNG
jgi:hypothetical protein